MVISNITIDPTSKKIVLRLGDRRKVSIFNDTVLIYDTASTVHLVKNLDLFEGVPVPVDDDDLSIIGFDNSSGHSFPVAIGILKFPLQGIGAYYSPSVVGNIISEPLLAKSHIIHTTRRSDSSLDTLLTCMRNSDSTTNLYWARSVEGIFVTDLSRKRADKVALTLSVSTSMSSRLVVEEQIVDWLRQMGLTESETLAALAVSRLTTPANMRRTLYMCLRVLDSNISDRRSTAIMSDYDAVLANRKATYGPPLLSEFDEVVESLRSITISGSVSLLKKRVRTDSVSSRKEREVRVGGSSDDEPVLIHETKLGQHRSPGLDLSANNGEVVSYPPTSGVSPISPQATKSSTTQSIDSGSMEPVRSNIQKDCCNSLANHSTTLDRSVSLTSSLAAPKGVETVSAFDVKEEAERAGSTRLGRQCSGTALSGLATSDVLTPLVHVSDNTKSNILEMNSGRVDLGSSITGDKWQERSHGTDLAPGDALIALWLAKSSLSPNDLLVGHYASTIGLTRRQEVIALSLEQRGLSKAQIGRIARVERLHKLTSFVGLSTLKRMIQHGTLGGLDGLTRPLMLRTTKNLYMNQTAPALSVKWCSQLPKNSIWLRTLLIHVTST